MSTSPDLSAASNGDRAAFGRLTEPLRSDLRWYAYRMMGSMTDADDVVQETLLRAWLAVASFEGRSTFRGWLYRIATNVCLTSLTQRRRRTLRFVTGPTDPDGPVPAALDASHWLEPVADAALPASGDPEQQLLLRESVRLAFLEALQRLPPQQRAVLVLRDVVGLDAAEVAVALDSAVTAVNSALQRARASVDDDLAADRRRRRPSPEQQADLLGRYMAAWSAGDVGALVALLTTDAEVTMPPIPSLFIGADGPRFLANTLLAGDANGRYRLRAIQVNGEPAAAAYTRDAEGAWQPAGVHVLTLDGDRIARVVAFVDPGQLRDVL
jgi:RNA polymerase sigma-70 factor (ECF subfamily)